MNKKKLLVSIIVVVILISAIGAIIFTAMTSGLTAKQKALKEVENYLSRTGLGTRYSREKMIDKIEEEYGIDNAIYAVDNSGADWKFEALATLVNFANSYEEYRNVVKAEEYLEREGFTREEIKYAIDEAFDGDKYIPFPMFSITPTFPNRTSQSKREELAYVYVRREFGLTYIIEGVEYIPNERDVWIYLKDAYWFDDEFIRDVISEFSHEK